MIRYIIIFLLYAGMMNAQGFLGVSKGDYLRHINNVDNLHLTNNGSSIVEAKEIMKTKAGVVYITAAFENNKMSIDD